MKASHLSHRRLGFLCSLTLGREDLEFIVSQHLIAIFFFPKVVKISHAFKVIKGALAEACKRKSDRYKLMSIYAFSKETESVSDNEQQNGVE